MEISRDIITVSSNCSNATRTLLTKTTAAQNDDALSYYTVRGLYFLAVVSVRSVVCNEICSFTLSKR